MHFLFYVMEILQHKLFFATHLLFVHHDETAGMYFFFEGHSP